MFPTTPHFCVFISKPTTAFPSASPGPCHARHLLAPPTARPHLRTDSVTTAQAPPPPGRPRMLRIAQDRAEVPPSLPSVRGSTHAREEMMLAAEERAHWPPQPRLALKCAGAGSGAEVWIARRLELSPVWGGNCGGTRGWGHPRGGFCVGRVALAAALGVAVGLGREGFGSPCLFRAAHVTSTELRGGVRRGRCGALEGEGCVCVSGGEEGKACPCRIPVWKRLVLKSWTGLGSRSSLLVLL